ncbi:MAG TPA: BamA/TamA family outer membrane protein [Chitinophagaceae bacterium]|jgi:outer membrane protein assembly factor BamA|nr:BamA/TamA family outer membrane protein [Chitinophagaceae bacterium]
MRQAFLFLLLAYSLIWLGCGSTKSVPANDKLYTGATVTVSGASTVRERKTLRSDLKALTRPKPNSKLLGIRFKLGIYNLFYKSKPKSLFGRLRDKMGEPPVLASQLDLEKNIQLLQNHLENKGYFRAKVTGDTIARRKMVKARYKAEAEEQYKINSIQFPTDSSALSLTIQQSAKNSLLKIGKAFDLDVIKAERSRIDAYLKERGYYFFSPEYLLIRTDSTIGNHLVDMYIVVKQGTPTETQEVYHINDIYVYGNYSLNTAMQDTTRANAELYKDYYIVQKQKRYKPRLFAEAMQFKKGDVYNRQQHNFTLNRLINLDLFKFVKNRFEPAKVDSPKLNVYYYLTPLPSKSLRVEITEVSRSNNLNGSDITFSWLHRNLFRNGSHLKLSAYVGSDVQFSGALAGYNTYRTGAEINFALPRFVVPFTHIQTYGGYAPRTNIKFGYDILKRQNLYTLNSYRVQYGYFWKENIQKQHELYPISINYVQPLNVTASYDSLRKIYPGLDKAIEPQFILGSIYQYNYNQLANGLKPINAYYFNGLIDLSGNIAGALTGANIKKGDTAKISNTPFSQYAKFEVEGRYYRNIGLKDVWASRIDIGIGLPYGNSVELPYIKQFFVGGSNSLRGFRSRAVGPGIYVPADTSDIIPDQTGDIKFEINTEYRPHISGPLYGAIFLDAGNIWLVNDSNYTQKPGAKFTSKWLSQLAVDAGVGLRFDITIFVIRLDVGFPLRKPWLQNPWVINQIRLGDSHWRKTNLVFNLAIGYPF